MAEAGVGAEVGVVAELGGTDQRSGQTTWSPALLLSSFLNDQ